MPSVAAQQRMKAYDDKHRRDFEFAVGDQVLLSTKHINLQRTGGGYSCRKLTIHRSVTVLESKGTYKLTLPSTLSRIHNVCNVCLLKPYRGHDPRALRTAAAEIGRRWSRGDVNYQGCTPHRASCASPHNLEGGPASR
jgi:hypothetical protein